MPLKTLLASLTPPAPAPAPEQQSRVAAATQIFRAPQRRQLASTQTLTGQKRVMALARKVAAVNRSEINFGNAFRSIQWVPMALGASGQPTPTEDRLVSAYCASLNRNKDWAAHLGRQLHTVGEGWLTVTRSTGMFQWEAWSISEIDTTNGATVRRSRGQQPQPLPAGTDLFRVWTEDTEYFNDAWSPLMNAQAVDAMETIVTLDALIKASDRSQLGAGVWKLPSEMFAAMRPLLETRDVNGNVVPVEDTALLQRFMSYWVDAASSDQVLTPMEQLAPLLAVAPGETLRGMEHVAVQPRYTADELAKRHDQAVKLLAMVMPTPEITLLGLSDSNHWNGKLEKDAAEQLYWSPLGWLVANAITSTHMRAYFHRVKQLGQWAGDPDKVLIAPDTSALTQPPADWNRDLAFFGQGLIGEHVVRARNGYGADDAPNKSERDRRALERWGDNMLSGGLTSEEKARLETSGLLPVDSNAPTPPTGLPPTTLTPATPPTVVAPTGPLVAAVTQPSARYETMVRRLAAIDERTAGALAMLAEQAMTATLREVGFTVRKRATQNPWRSRVANVAPPGSDPLPLFSIGGITAAVLSPAEVEEQIRLNLATFEADAAELLDEAREDAWDVVESTFGQQPSRPRDRNRVVEAAALLAAMIRIRVQVWVGGGDRADSTVRRTRSNPHVHVADIASVLATAGGAGTTITADGVTIPNHSVPSGLGLGGDIWGVITATVPPTTTTVPQLKWVRELEWVHDHPKTPRPEHVAINGRRGIIPQDFDGHIPGALYGCKCRLAEIWTVQNV